MVGPTIAPLTIVDQRALIHYRNIASGDRNIRQTSFIIGRKLYETE
jgi:hypothetical protein